MNTVQHYSYTKKDLAMLPTRPERSSKGTFGRLLCVCGSEGMAGASYLAAKAAYRTGAGLVEILTPECNRTVLQTLIPEAIISTYSAESPSASAIRASVARADALVIGCGLGVSLTSQKVLSAALCAANIPCVIDADALNIISKNAELFYLLKGRIITPHPAEMSRLLGGASAEKIKEILGDIPSVAHSFAKEHGCVCVLKDHRTAVSDGSERVYINQNGNSGMATGGSGDVLAGIIGGILAQMKDAPDPMLAATLGVYIHSLCGDKAAEELGEYSLIASDIIDALPKVLRGIER